VDSGASVTGITRTPRQPPIWDHPFYTRISVVRGDVAQVAGSVVGREPFDLVFHLAVESIAARTARDFETSVRRAHEGCQSLLDSLAKSAPAARVILASSRARYGQTLPALVTEDVVGGDLSTYGELKRAVEDDFCSTAKRLGLSFRLGRLSNVYGGGDLNLSRLVPELTLAALRGEAARPRANPQMTCDLLYVTDAVEGLLRIALSDDSLDGLAFNLATGVETPIGAIAATISALARPASSRCDGSPQLRKPDSGPVLSIERARTLVGFCPRVSLRRGIWRTVRWYRRRIVRPELAQALHAHPELMNIARERRMSARFDDGEGIR